MSDEAFRYGNIAAASGVHVTMKRLLAIVLVAAAGCSMPRPSTSPGTASHTALGPTTMISASPTPGRPSTPSGRLTAQACPVTIGNGMAPPGQPADPNYLGNGRLFVSVWPHGWVFVPPDDIGADGWLGMKFPWWRGTGVDGVLRIRGQEITTGANVRADVPDGYGRTGFQATAIYFPTRGCYTITGEIASTHLTFVTLVRPCSALSELAAPERADYAICL
jgi:hypothetical protein